MRKPELKYCLYADFRAEAISLIEFLHFISPPKKTIFKQTILTGITDEILHFSSLSFLN